MATHQQQLESSFRNALQRPLPSGQTQAAAALDGSLGPTAGRRKDAAALVLDIGRIVPDASQVRRMGKDASNPEIIDFAESVKALGVLQALEVRWRPALDSYQLVSGERRLVAARLAGLTEVPVRVVDIPDEEVLRRQIHENIHRADLPPLDLANGLQLLRQDGASLEDLARQACRSKSWVQSALSVAQKLTPEAKAVVSTGAGEPLSMEALSLAAQMPEEEQAPLLLNLQQEKQKRDELRQRTAGGRARAKDKQPGERRRTGRPAKIRLSLLERSFSVLDGLATVTVRCPHAEHLAQSLREALDQLLAEADEAQAA